MSTVPVRVQAAVYAAGLFSSTMPIQLSVVVPLWLLAIGADPVMVGISVGIFHFGPMLFSVHGGAMMDRLGPRRVMLMFAGVAMLLPPLYPLLPWSGAILLLQVVLGTCAAMGWVGSQSMIGHFMKGEAVYAGRLTFVSLIGNLFGPPIAGAAWDAFGAWGGFGVAMFWTVGLFGAALALPRWTVTGRHGRGAAVAATVQAADTASTPADVPEPHAPKPDEPGGRKRPRGVRIGWRDFVPRLESYTAAFSLLAVPAVAFVVMVSMMRIAGHGMQNSFYVVYLNGTGYSGTAIGVLMASMSVAAMAGSLIASPLTRWIKSTWLQFAGALVSVLAIAATPLLGLYLVLIAAQLVRGACIGISTPLIISDMSAAVGSAQGKAVGLRTMSNRIMSFITPIAMGGIVAVVGLETGFLVIGGIVIVMMACVAAFGIAKKVI